MPTLAEMTGKLAPAARMVKIRLTSGAMSFGTRRPFTMS
jgi:hypothetical protein